MDPDQARQCRDLAAYLRSDKRRPTRDQVAVHVLTHEAMHLSGRLDEPAAECAAVQRDAHTARLLGAPADAAAGLAASYWRTIYPRMPDGYRSPECRPGGAMDERLADAPWFAPPPSSSAAPYPRTRHAPDWRVVRIRGSLSRE